MKDIMNYMSPKSQWLQLSESNNLVDSFMNRKYFFHFKV